MVATDPEKVSKNLSEEGTEDPDTEGSSPEGSSDSVNADGLQSAIDSVAKFLNQAFDTIVEPLVGGCSLLEGKWERSGGNYLLRPQGRAKAVVHFLGGAFFGAAPHISYRTFLELLVQRGFCVVASPYDLRLDFLALTADVVAKWEAVETDLALDYGAIPVLGIGHSAGALFHTIASSLFDDMTPKAGNILISFNNMPIKRAIPLFDITVLPFAKQAVQLEKQVPEPVRVAIESFPGTVDAAVEGSPLTPKRFKESFLPLSKEARSILEQLPPLIRELGGVPRPRGVSAEDGKRPQELNEFYPPPADVESAISQMYPVRETLIVKFTNDMLDESDKLLASIRKRGTVVDVSMMELSGNHLTPLTQDIPTSNLSAKGDESPVPNIMQGLVEATIREGVAALGIKDLGVLVSLIDEWFEAGIANDKL